MEGDAAQSEGRVEPQDQGSQVQTNEEPQTMPGSTTVQGLMTQPTTLQRETGIFSFATVRKESPHYKY